jgi:hypothetical protein
MSFGGMASSAGGTATGGTTASAGGTLSMGGSTGVPVTTSQMGIRCDTDENGQTGWYSGSYRICASKCTGCVARCLNVGTKSEGAYSSCGSSESGCSGAMTGLIRYGC